MQIQTFHTILSSDIAGIALEKRREKVLADIRKASKSIRKSTVETTAYLRALGKSKGLDIQTFRKEVQEELQNQDGMLHFHMCTCTLRISFVGINVLDTIPLCLLHNLKCH